MGFNIGPRILKATGGGISREGSYRVHQFPPQHVTDGLVGYVDFGNTNCFTEDLSETIQDLSGANVMGPGTLNGNFSKTDNWKNDNGGCIKFDGNISCNWSGSSTFPVLKTFTADMWVRFLGASTNGFHVLFQKDGGYSGGEVYGIRATDAYAFTSTVWHGGGSGEINVSQSTSNQSVNTWVHVAARYDENFVLRLFVNGVDNSASSGQGTGGIY